jgi:hypothetical protein
VTKKDILEKLALNFDTYQATSWLGKKIKSLNNQTPAKLILDNKIKEVMKELDLEIKKRKRKRKT